MKNDLITRYRNAAITHGEGTRSGDSVKTNRAYDELGVSLKKITETGNDELLFSLYDDDIWVQIWAAAHTLEVNEEKALTKLQVIMDAAIPLASTGARYTIQEWKRGKLTFRVGVLK